MLGKAILVAACLLCGAHAHAFGEVGHVLICEIAYRELTAPARAELNRLLQASERSSSFSQACVEADRAPRARPPAHYVNYGRDQLAIASDRCPGADECVLGAIASDLALLADPDRPAGERGTAMVLLGHWVGDVHQPLHVSYADDRGGNGIDTHGVCGQQSLHSVWDSCLVELRVLQPGLMARLLGWAGLSGAGRNAAALHGEISDAQRDEWIGSPPLAWAQESYAIALREDLGYCHLRDGCWYAPNNKRLDRGEPRRRIEIDDDYLDRHAPTVRLRLSQAGIRLAGLLNRALDQN